MVKAEDIAFVLHEEWRKTRLKKDGTYEPRWKKIKDAEYVKKLDKEDLPGYIRLTEEGYEIDIANASYNLLSADWQNENKAAAEVVADLVNSGKKLSRDQIGDIVHNAWLERNSWAKDGELGVPFAQLPKEEQDKDIAQYEIALTMSQAKEVEVLAGTRLDAVCKFILNCASQGENVFINFNGRKFYSKFDTFDTCYLKIFGMTKQEREEKLKLIEDSKERKIAEAKSKLPGLKERGESLIYPERKEEWNDFVESFASGYFVFGLEDIVKVMEALAEGKSVDEAEKEAIDGESVFRGLNAIITFSKRGPEFGRSYGKKIWGKDLNGRLEAHIAKTEEENAIYAKNEMARKAEQANSTAAISSEKTAQPIPTKNNKKAD